MFYEHRIHMIHVAQSNLDSDKMKLLMEDYVRTLMFLSFGLQVTVTATVETFLPWLKTSAMWERCHVVAPIRLHFQRMDAQCGPLEEETTVCKPFTSR